MTVIFDGQIEIIDYEEIGALICSGMTWAINHTFACLEWDYTDIAASIMTWTKGPNKIFLTINKS